MTSPKKRADCIPLLIRSYLLSTASSRIATFYPQLLWQRIVAAGPMMHRSMMSVTDENERRDGKLSHLYSCRSCSRPTMWDDVLGRRSLKHHRKRLRSTLRSTTLFCSGQGQLFGATPTAEAGESANKSLSRGCEKITVRRDMMTCDSNMKHALFGVSNLQTGPISAKASNGCRRSLNGDRYANLWQVSQWRFYAPFSANLRHH